MRLIAHLIAICLVAASIGHAQTCPPGGPCPIPETQPGSDYGRQPTQPQRPQGSAEKSDAHPAVCRVEVRDGSRAIAYGSGTLIDVEGDHGLVVTAAHVVRQGGATVRCRFPDGQIVEGKKLTRDKYDHDIFAILVERPRGIEPVDVATKPPPNGTPVWIAGYGGTGQFRAARGNLTAGSSPGSWRVNGAAARQGDSGGPVLDERGRLVAVLWGTDGRNTVATASDTTDQFLTRAGRYLLPWNGDIERERERQRGETERERIRNENQPPPYYQPPSGGGSDGRLEARVDALSRELSELRSNLERVRGELPDDLQTRIDRALSEADQATQIAKQSDVAIDSAKREVEEQRSLIRRLREDVINIGDGKIAGAISTEDAAALARRIVDERVPDAVKERVKDSLPWWVGPGIAAAVALAGGGGIAGAIGAFGSSAVKSKLGEQTSRLEGKLDGLLGSAAKKE